MAAFMGIVFSLCFLLALILRAQRGKEEKVSLWWNAMWSPLRVSCAAAVAYIPAFGVAYWMWIHIHWVPALVIAVIVLFGALIMLWLALKTTRETRKILEDGLPEKQLEALAFQREIQERAPSS